MKPLSFKKSIVEYLILAVIIFMSSLSFFAYYTGGDQIHYIYFYSAIKGVNFNEVGPIAIRTINSSETLSTFVLWLGSNLGFPKEIWISLLNVILSLLLYALLKKYNAPSYVIFLIYTNFYIIVLFTSAERLKIAYIILLCAFLLDGLARKILLLVVPLAHFQSIIYAAAFIIARSSYRVQAFVKSFHIPKQPVIKSFLPLSLIFLLAGLTYTPVSAKISSYASRILHFSDLPGLLIALTVGFLATANRFRLLLTLFPLSIPIVLIGSFRLNITVTTILFSILLVERRLAHPASKALLFYFSLKSIPFIINIYTKSNGFA